MAKAGVKCSYCKQTMPVRSMGKETPDINVIVVRHVAEAVSTAPISSA